MRTRIGRFQSRFHRKSHTEQWWGTEILSHEPGAVDLSRLADNRAPCLLNHWGDQSRRGSRTHGSTIIVGYADLRFSKSQTGQAKSIRTSWTVSGARSRSDIQILGV